MSKLNLTEWAAVSEIIGTVAVVTSLLFVAFSINHNTAVMQATNDNFVYELQYARVRDIVGSPGMASIYVKIDQNEELSAEEEKRFYWDKLQEIGTWEIAFNRHRRHREPQTDRVKHVHPKRLSILYIRQPFFDVAKSPAQPTLTPTPPLSMSHL